MTGVQKKVGLWLLWRNNSQFAAAVGNGAAALLVVAAATLREPRSAGNAKIGSSYNLPWSSDGAEKWRGVGFEYSFFS